MPSFGRLSPDKCFNRKQRQLDHKEKAKRLRLKAKIFSLQLLAFSLSLTSFAAQPGAVDLSFDPGTGVASLVYSIAVQTNGAILVGGFFAQAIHTPRIGIARLGVDGVLDATFNPVLGGSPFSTVFALAVQGDGKILVGGSFTSVNGTPTTNLARLNVNGTVDGTFTPVSIAGGQLLQPFMRWLSMAKERCWPAAISPQ